MTYITKIDIDSSIGGQLKATWEVDNPKGLGSFWVYSKPSSSSAWPVPVAVGAAVRTYTITGLSQNTEYDIEVRPFISGGAKTVKATTATTVNPPPPPTPSSMLVGLNAGGWGSDQYADVGGCVKVVRLDSANPQSADISPWINAGFKVVMDFAGPYNSSGISSIDPVAWANNAANWFAKNPQCSVIEILNEPYGDWFWGSNSRSAVNTAAYAVLIKTVHDLFTARFGVNKPKLVAAYGDSGSPFWAGVVAADKNVTSYLDGITVHPYGGHSSNSAAGNLDLVAKAHTATGLPVYVTEVGWPTALGQPETGDSLQWSEVDQAKNIYNFIDTCRKSGNVALVIIFGYRDYGTNAWYGVEDHSGRKKPSYTTLKEAALGLPMS